jgi:hypothetical protein
MLVNIVQANSIGRTMDGEQLRSEYLAKAEDAKEKAAKSNRPEDREKWERIEAAFRGLADTA